MAEVLVSPVDIGGFFVSSARRGVIMAVFCVLLLLCGARSAKAEEAFFLQVLDAETIRVFPKASNKEINVHLYGIDASEMTLQGRKAILEAYREHIRTGDVVDIVPMTTNPLNTNPYVNSGHNCCVTALVFRTGNLINYELLRRGKA